MTQFAVHFFPHNFWGSLSNFFLLDSEWNRNYPLAGADEASHKFQFAFASREDKYLIINSPSARSFCGASAGMERPCWVAMEPASRASPFGWDATASSPASLKSRFSSRTSASHRRLVGEPKRRRFKQISE